MELSHSFANWSDWLVSHGVQMGLSNCHSHSFLLQGLTAIFGIPSVCDFSAALLKCCDLVEFELNIYAE